MESLGVFAEADQCDFFSRLLSNENQEFDFAAPHFLADHDEASFPFQHNDEGFDFESQTILCPDPPEASDEMGLMTMFDHSLFNSLNTLSSSNMYYFPQENSHNACSATNCNYISGDSCYYDMSTTPIDVEPTFIPAPFGDITGIVCNTGDYSGRGGMGISNENQQPKEGQLKRTHDAANWEEKSNTTTTEDASDSTSKKKPRLSKDKTKKGSVRAKKGQKAKDENAENNAAVDRQSSSAYNSSEDDQESGEVTDPKSSSSLALNLNGRTRANRGSATDPQSLYARKRRERINERLRVLQNIVPKGTKVDISTMLEEAVHYVKFLQLQIKLLSSDEMWMYAPIAYNGMDIGLGLDLDL